MIEDLTLLGQIEFAPADGVDATRVWRDADGALWWADDLPGPDREAFAHLDDDPTPHLVTGPVERLELYLGWRLRSDTAGRGGQTRDTAEGDVAALLASLG